MHFQNAVFCLAIVNMLMTQKQLYVLSVCPSRTKHMLVKAAMSQPVEDIAADHASI